MISERCLEILQTLNNSVWKKETPPLPRVSYRYNAETILHVDCLPKKADINYIKTIVSDFNTKNYEGQPRNQYNVNELRRHLLIIKTFQSD